MVEFTTDVIRDGDDIFVLTEGLFASDIPDVNEELDADVSSYIKAFEGARETSRQKADFSTPSGRALPARQFSFESKASTRRVTTTDSSESGVAARRYG
jgi:hypothetical protein